MYIFSWFFVYFSLSKMHQSKYSKYEIKLGSLNGGYLV